MLLSSKQADEQTMGRVSYVKSRSETLFKSKKLANELLHTAEGTSKNYGTNYCCQNQEVGR